MPVTIEEMEVIATPATRGDGDTAAPTDTAGAPDARPAELQRALQTWAWLDAERRLRLDDC